MSRRYPDEFYKQVAEVYLEALDETIDTGGVVMETWGVPRSTAHRWIKRARELGFLGPRPSFCSSRCPIHCPEVKSVTGRGRRRSWEAEDG